MRIFFLPIPCILLFINSFLSNLIATVLLLFLSLTDYFDGLLARKYNRTSKLGALLDPIADKIFITTIYLILVKLNYFPYLPVFLLLLREIWISFLRSIFPQKMKVHLIAKFKTFFQMTLAVGVVLAKTFYPNLNTSLIEMLIWGVVFLSYLSAFGYVLRNMNNLNLLFHKNFRNKLIYEILYPLFLLLIFPFIEEVFWIVPLLMGIIFLKGAKSFEPEREERFIFFDFIVLFLVIITELILLKNLKFSLFLLLVYLLFKEGIKSLRVFKESLKV